MNPRAYLDRTRVQDWCLGIVRKTGGLQDTVEHLDVGTETGNGFVFETFDTGGLRWAVDDAMRFWAEPPDVREAQIRRVMVESKARFSHAVTAELTGAITSKAE